MCRDGHCIVERTTPMYYFYHQCPNQYSSRSNEDIPQAAEDTIFEALGISQLQSLLELLAPSFLVQESWILRFHKFRCQELITRTFSYG